MFKEFKKFIMRGNVLDMAVGIIIGNAFKDIVDSLVDNIIMPAISCLIGKVDISGLTANIGEIHIAYGQFLNTILNFLIIAFSLFMAIKLVNNKKDQRYISPDTSLTFFVFDLFCYCTATAIAIITASSTTPAILEIMFHFACLLP